MPMYRQAVRAGIYLATMDDSMRELKRGNYELQRSESEQLELERRLEEHQQRKDGIVHRGIKRQRHQAKLKSTKPSLLSDVTSNISQKAQQRMAAKLHKLTYHKGLRPFWKMLARYRTLTTFTPAQMRQFFYGVALTMHLFTKYNRRMTNLNQQLKSVFILVVLPFGVPPFVMLVIPTLFFLIPLLLVLTAFTALNREARAIMERNKKRHKFRKQNVLSTMGGRAVTFVGDAIREGSGVIGDSLYRIGSSSERTFRSVRKRTDSLFRRKGNGVSSTDQQDEPPLDDLVRNERSESGVSVSTLASSTYFETMHLQEEENNKNDSSFDLDMGSSFDSSDSILHQANKDTASVFRSVSPQSGTESMVDTTPPTTHTKKQQRWFRTSSNDTPTTEPSTSSSLRRSTRRTSFDSAMFLKKKKKPNRPQASRRVSFAATGDVRKVEVVIRERTV